MYFDISDWLANIGLSQYAKSFADEGIDEASLGELTDGDLQALGVDKMGHRKTILREASRLSGGASVPSHRPPAPAASGATPKANDTTRSAADQNFVDRAEIPLKLFLSYGRDDLVHGSSTLGE